MLPRLGFSWKILPQNPGGLKEVTSKITLIPETLSKTSVAKLKNPQLGAPIWKWPWTRLIRLLGRWIFSKFPPFPSFDPPFSSYNQPTPALSCSQLSQKLQFSQPSIFRFLPVAFLPFSLFRSPYCCFFSSPLSLVPFLSISPPNSL